MSRVVIVHGQPGCGKSRNANLIAEYFGANYIIDEGYFETREVEFNKLKLHHSCILVLCQNVTELPEYMREGASIVSYLEWLQQRDFAKNNSAWR